MELKSIRALLLKKAENEELKSLLNKNTDDQLGELIIGSLVKMASYRDKKATKYNDAVGDFLHHAVAEKSADEPNPIEGLRDALGHHASHYAAAHRAGRKDLAEAHAKQFTKLGHLAGKLDAAANTISSYEPGHSAEHRASMGAIADFKAPDLQAWQSTSPQHFADSNKNSGVDITGWRAHSKQTGVRLKGDGSSVPNKLSFAWYANDPHPTHRDTPEHKAKGNDRGYPFEQVKVNDKHIPIGIVPAPEDSQKDPIPHPFDSHPIVSHFDDSPETYLKNADAYKNKLGAFHAGPNGLAVAKIAAQGSHPESGAKPGMVVHPKMPKGGSND